MEPRFSYPNLEKKSDQKSHFFEDNKSYYLLTTDFVPRIVFKCFKNIDSLNLDQRFFQKPRFELKPV